MPASFERTQDMGNVEQVECRLDCASSLLWSTAESALTLILAPISVRPTIMRRCVAKSCIGSPTASHSVQVAADVRCLKLSGHSLAGNYSWSLPVESGNLYECPVPRCALPGGVCSPNRGCANPPPPSNVGPDCSPCKCKQSNARVGHADMPENEE